MKKFNVPFIFTTNGNLYAEYADDTGSIRDALSLTAFPNPEEPKHRYENIKTIQLESELAKSLPMPYKGGESARYYFQDAAICATLEKLIKGNKRVLLSLATGTGKTIITVQFYVKCSILKWFRRIEYVLF